MMRRGYLLLVLHAHLPFVRHPEHEGLPEERWLFEAVTECYLPLLAALERLQEEGLAFRITLSLSPPLIAMLQDPLLQQRYLRHLERLLELLDRERLRNRKDSGLRVLAEFHARWFTATRRRYLERYGCDPVAGFRRLADAGVLELITSAATHGFLPLLRQEPAAVGAQLRVAADFFQQRIGRPAPAIWLPECGYYQGLEQELKAAGLGWFFVESHGLLHARPHPRHGVQEPLACGNAVVAFGRDPACSREVWSGEDGYPGHPLYREFHRDIGFELAPAQLGALALADGGCAPTGIKYHRITDRRGGAKALYDPKAARARARRDAADFVRRRIRAIGRSELRDRPPLFVAPYDAELLGHWWFEGPYWLEQVIREAATGDTLELIGASDYLRRHPVLPRAAPSPSSWGEGGYSRFWLSGDNAWLYPHLHRAAREMRELVATHPAAAEGTLVRRALDQAARSLLLAQASDWPFLIRSGGAVDYAVRRVQEHLSRFRFLHRALRQGRIDRRRLCALEQMDNLFPELDYRVFGG